MKNDSDRKLYFVSQPAGTFVVAAKPEYELLAHKVIAADDSRTDASPAVSHGQLFLRHRPGSVLHRQTVTRKQPTFAPPRQEEKIQPRMHANTRK